MSLRVSPSTRVFLFVGIDGVINAERTPAICKIDGISNLARSRPAREVKRSHPPLKESPDYVAPSN